MKPENYSRGVIAWPAPTSLGRVEVTVVRLNRGGTMTVVLLEDPPASVLQKGDVIKVDQSAWKSEIE